MPFEIKYGPHRSHRHRLNVQYQARLNVGCLGFYSNNIKYFNRLTYPFKGSTYLFVIANVINRSRLNDGRQTIKNDRRMM